ncbi:MULTISPECIES: bifunctional riboflavin kinase/FAD synthetase [Bacteroidota]|uniref:Riboflavin biosynthesis protein n=1 Tax=Schleiferia thermophila TaxID=884107 RepID=A0A369A6M5_9FLAO|nr:bifunctional riboflavin kinase/FAD synthetase [Schleiferia thermophila]PMB29472.1 riboflavin biosynthesis protein RibF [Fischerella thermalis CCMEE 5319]RCX03986.1 riboflavin kinase/FMN adenylyltransferase [Schleiferia thermophila]GCD80218.1 riboflavin biosynthesis protein [Schleiferia thermophila]
MKVFYSIDEFTAPQYPVVTMGTFDGVHIGHRSIISRLNEVAAMAEGGESVLITFKPHPRLVLQPEADIKLLNDEDEKIELLRKAGLQNLIFHPFSIEFSKTSGEEFVRKYLVQKVKARALVIGHDHHFGRNREGSYEHLVHLGQLYGFSVESLSAQAIHGVVVSSTKVRKTLLQGDVDTANQWLGYPYAITGMVVKGRQIGEKIGFPTANILNENPHKLIPGDGVYAVMVSFVSDPGTKLMGMCNIGHRPTVVTGGFKTIEVHIFDFHGNIYNQVLRIEFVSRIRPEKKFNDLNALRRQLERDQMEALRRLTRVQK